MSNTFTCITLHVTHLRCLNKAGWMQTGLFLHTYCTTLSPSPRNRLEAAPAFALNAFPARGNVFFSERSHCAPFLSACDESVGWQAEHNHAWAHGSWKGFFAVTHSVSTLQLAERELLSLYESPRQSCLVEMQAQCYKTSLFSSLSHHHRKNGVEISFW